MLGYGQQYEPQCILSTRMKTLCYCDIARIALATTSSAVPAAINAETAKPGNIDINGRLSCPP